jgi:hypothetical protein
MSQHTPGYRLPQRREEVQLLLSQRRSSCDGPSPPPSSFRRRACASLVLQFVMYTCACMRGATTNYLVVSYSHFNLGTAAGKGTPGRHAPCRRRHAGGAAPARARRPEPPPAARRWTRWTCMPRAQQLPREAVLATSIHSRRRRVPLCAHITLWIYCSRA